MSPLRKIIASTAVAAVLAVSPLAGAPASAVSRGAVSASSVSTVMVKTAFIPEWYQYCYNTRPVGITAGKSGYMNAYQEARGVTCKWWVMPWRAGVPSIVTKYFSWDTVCRYYGSRYVEMKRGLPWCR